MAWLLGAIVLALQAPATAPQAPIAAGSFDSIVEVLGAAKVCGVQSLRIELYHTDLLGDVRLYLMEDPSTSDVRCLDAWLTANGRRLRLVGHDTPN
jgi:hypothetical protein